MRTRRLILGIGAGAALARAALTTVTVQGSSMEPTMRHGEVWLALRRRRPRPGLLVSAEAPGEGGAAPVLVKRIAAMNLAPSTCRVPGCPEALPPATAWLLGDNPHRSVDSRQLGPFPLHAFRAYPVVRIGREQRPT